VSEHLANYLSEASRLCRSIPMQAMDALAEHLATLRARGGRLFLLGVGGGAAHASHAANDFRKLCNIEAYAPTDNVAELTARTNDEGWDTTFIEWLRVSRLRPEDGLFVFSVGGGSREHNVSMNLVRALEFGHERGCSIFGVVGKSDGATARLGDVVVVIEAPPEMRTPLVEGLQAVVWHGLVSHPSLAERDGKWETVEAPALVLGGDEIDVRA
jgi:D-sedoheptulose 7-phosphate isomerase